MPKFKVDLNESNFQPIPAGKYEAYVYDIKHTTFNSSGNEGFKITYNIAAGEHKGRRVFDNLVITPKAYWKLGQFWAAVTGDTGVVEVDTDKIPDYVGSRVELEVDVEQQEYKGKEQKRNIVKNVLFLGGKVPVADSDDLAEMLDEREPIAVGDDDVPF